MFICGAAGNNFYGQDPVLKSLKLQFKSAVHDSAKCRILSALAETAPDGEWEKYNRLLGILAKRNMDLADTTLKSFYLNYYASSLSNNGIYLMDHGRDDEAIQCYDKSAEIQRSTGDLGGLAVTNNNMATIHNNRGNIELAMTCYSENLKIFERLKDKKNVAITLNNLGVLFFNQKDAAKAKDYYEKSLRLMEQIGDLSGICDSYNNIAFVFYSQGEFSRALEYYNKSLSIAESIKDEAATANVLNNIGLVYSTTKENSKAISYYEKCLSIQEKTGDLQGFISSNIGMAYVLLQIKEYKRSEIYCLKALKLAEKLGYPERIQHISRLLLNIYEIKKDPEKALQMFELSIQMRDSIFNNDTRKASFRAQLKYEYEKKAEADSIVAGREKKLNAAKLQYEKVQRRSLGGGLILTVLFGIYIFNRFRLEKKQKRVIQEQKAIVEKQKAMVEEKQNEIMSSIRYAKRIQQSLLPNEKYILFTLNRLK